MKQLGVLSEIRQFYRDGFIHYAPFSSATEVEQGCELIESLSLVQQVTKGFEPRSG